MRQVAAIVVFAMLTVGQPMADHLDETRVARGKPEHILCGIEVTKSRIADVIRLYGTPIHVEDNPLEDTPGSGEPNYVWEKNGVRMEIGTGYYTRNGKRIESETYSVKVSGKGAHGSLGRTSAGLALGMKWTRLKQLYGNRFFRSSKSSFLIEFRDETRLYVSVDDSGRITSMHLLANIE